MFKGFLFGLMKNISKHNVTPASGVKFVLQQKMFKMSQSQLIIHLKPRLIKLFVFQVQLNGCSSFIALLILVAYLFGGNMLYFDGPKGNNFYDTH